jgi:hypothetical protein
MALQKHADTGASTAPDRRRAPRLVSELLRVSIRQRRSFRRRSATVLDFNRHGIALLTSQAWRSNAQLTLELSHHGVINSLKVLGIVHNSVPLAEGFRIGIRFRPQFRHQFDSERIEAYLAALEAAVACEALASA